MYCFQIFRFFGYCYCHCYWCDSMAKLDHIIHMTRLILCCLFSLLYIILLCLLVITIDKTIDRNARRWAQITYKKPPSFSVRRSKKVKVFIAIISVLLNDQFHDIHIHCLPQIPPFLIYFHIETVGTYLVRNIKAQRYFKSNAKIRGKANSPHSLRQIWYFQ